ncbi:hypothetical protein COO60DRAFT_1524354 [Scenedesmus sp. NREL 46B-D3]|nr:hypothetical protein COO60DRAFT_1524190 [Scenedesmus sp. NREL 46B-D3]KAF6257409.1 hypothetical protein COO60DRAFT_1524354 [Scenedesmus sp. NREL 46B-D3]
MDQGALELCGAPYSLLLPLAAACLCCFLPCCFCLQLLVQVRPDLLQNVEVRGGTECEDPCCKEPVAEWLWGGACKHDGQTRLLAAIDV